MRHVKRLFILLFFVSAGSSSAQQMTLGFESGDFEQPWQFYTGDFPGVDPVFGAVSDSAQADRHTIVTRGCYDSVVNIACVPPLGGDFACRLGNWHVGAEAERLVVPLAIDSSNMFFRFMYAVVLEDPDHIVDNQPRFEFSIRNELTGDYASSYACSYYKVIAAANMEGFQSVGEYRYRDWSTMVMDLSEFYGQRIVLEFTTTDCAQGQHAGWAYLDFLLGPKEPITVAGGGFCAGDSVVVLAGPQDYAGYHWSTGETTRDITVRDPVDGRRYTLNALTESGCPSSYDITLDADTTSLHLLAGDTAICLGDTVTVRASAGGGHYLWHTGLTTQFFEVSPARTEVYRVTMTQGYCVVLDSARVLVHPLPAPAPVSNAPVCAGQRLTLDLARKYSFYSWSGPQLFTSQVKNPTVSISSTPLQSGDYIVEVMDSNGCAASHVLRVQVNALPQVSAVSTSTCYGQLVSLSGQGAATYIWDHGISNDVPFTPTGTKMYAVIGADENGCSNTAAAQVVVHPLPPVAAAPSVVCLGRSAVLSGQGAVDYRWSDGIVDGEPFVPLVTTTYHVTGTDANGCAQTAAVTVLVAKNPLVSAGPDRAICHGEQVSLQASGGTTYQWGGEGPATAVWLVQPAATSTYWVTATDVNCTAQDSVVILVYPVPDATIDGNTALCELDTSVLTASGGMHYLWNNSDTNRTITIKPVKNMGYTVTVIEKKCYDSADVEITLFPLPRVALSANFPCEGGWLYIEAASSNATGYKWSGPNGFASTSAAIEIYPATHLHAGNYILTTTVADVCYRMDTFSVSVLPAPMANFTYSPAKPTNQDSLVIFENLSEGFQLSETWHVGDPHIAIGTDHQAVFDKPGVYDVMLTVMDTNQCADSVLKQLTVLADHGLYAANAFTPTGDGINDGFTPVGWGFDRESWRFYVFSRWGEQVFHTEVYGEQWDGRKRGLREVAAERCPIGCYAWLVLLKDRSGKRHRYVGEVCLLH